MEYKHVHVYLHRFLYEAQMGKIIFPPFLKKNTDFISKTEMFS